VQPVGRLRPLPLRVALCFGLGAAAMAMYATLSPRPDLARQLIVPSFIIEILALAVASLLLAVLALQGARPGREPGAMAWSLTLGVLALAAAVAFGHARDPGVPIDAFVSVGMPCATATLGLAMAPGLAYLVALRRGAPLAPVSSGALAGGAALLLAYLAMRLHCPLDEGFHLFVWHILPAIPAMLLGAAVGALWLRRWQR
jgi:hypothetical protein